MKIIHWNISKASHPVYALRKYEDELYRNLMAIKGGSSSLKRIRRPENDILGSTVFSWIFYKGYDADVVHATSQTLAPAIYFKNINKFVVTVHDLAPIVYPSEIANLSLKVQYLLTPTALKRADRIITDSNFTKDELLRLTKLNEDQIDVVHLGVDHERYRPMDKFECKEKFGLKQEDKHILVVSSNLEHKRMDLAKKLFEHIRSKRKDVKMIKAGYGEVLEGDDIISVGWVPEDDMPFLFNAADAYLHTSEYEGFGLPVLEAMSCGVPVIASNKASIPEIVGDSGVLLDLDTLNYSDILGEISSLIDGGLDKGAVKQSNNFSWEKTAGDTLGIYKTLLEG
ncbi:MAG TPA: glycosyltransferase family 4 protein [Methanotrichaceae archaeon]|nr:glycosyltransferase family 4 protein [Methanotrichaceae archaeon]